MGTTILIIPRIYQSPLSLIPESGRHRTLRTDLVAPFAATSLFLVSKGGIRYYAKSDDPIFPAQSRAHTSWPLESRWSHLGIARTILGCVDEKYVRDRERKHEWYLIDGQLHDMASDRIWNITPPALVATNETPYSDTDFTALQLLCLALRFSDTASAAQFVRSNWLDAASRVVHGIEGDMSLPLDPFQWQIESHRLFNISLARMQTEIIAMTRMSDIGSQDYLKNFFQNRSVDPCGLIKINADGWRNISIIGLAGMLGLALGLWLITLETGDTIVLVWLYRRVARPSSLLLLSGIQKAWQLATRGLRWLREKL